RVHDVGGGGGDGVGGGGEGEGAVAREAPVRRLHPAAAAEGGGLAHGAAGVRAEGAGGQPARHGRRRAARRAAGHACEIPRVARELEGGVLGGRAHRELVHVGLA